MGFKLEQQFLIEDFNRNIENLNLEEAKFLLRHLFKTSLQQKNGYLELMQHHWFKPKGGHTVKEHLQEIQTLFESLFNQIIQNDTPTDWRDSQVQRLICLLQEIDSFLDEFNF